MNIVKVLKGIGHVLLGVLGGIRKVVTDDILIAATHKAIELADNKLLNNETRRHQLIAYLMNTFHLNENLARWVLETVVYRLKNQAEFQLENEVKDWLATHQGDSESEQPGPVVGTVPPAVPPFKDPAGLPAQETQPQIQGGSVKLPVAGLSGVGTFTPPVAGKDAAEK